MDVTEAIKTQISAVHYEVMRAGKLLRSLTPAQLADSRNLPAIAERLTAEEIGGLASGAIRGDASKALAAAIVEREGTAARVRDLYAAH